MSLTSLNDTTVPGNCGAQSSWLQWQHPCQLSLFQIIMIMHTNTLLLLLLYHIDNRSDEQIQLAHDRDSYLPKEQRMPWQKQVEFKKSHTTFAVYNTKCVRYWSLDCALPQSNLDCWSSWNDASMWSKKCKVHTPQTIGVIYCIAQHVWSTRTPN